jgi:hypothetical protein
MTCEFAQLDAVYVLGSLGASERTAYERHLATCDECSRAVRELAGLPGLMGRVPPDVLEAPGEREPAPETLLPNAVAAARRWQGRRRLVSAMAVAAAVVVLAMVGVGIGFAVLGDEDPPSAAPAAPVSTAPARQMESLGTPSFGWVSLTERGWGTRIDLTCTYEGRLAGRTTYELVVRGKDGTTERVGSWRSDRGEEVHVTMASALAPADIVAVVVRTDSGYPVLRLTP